MDGRMIPIRTPLRNGTVVEILTSSRSAPRKDWLKSVVTSKAVTRIRAFLRQKERAEAAVLGRERCAREAKRIGRRMEDMLRWEPFLAWMHRQGLHSLDEVYAAEGLGKISLREVLEKLMPGAQPSKPVRPRRVRPRAPAHSGEGPRVQVSGMHDLLVRFARCCSPKPGDPLQGIVTRGHTVSIHHRDCGNVTRVRAQPARLVDANWSGGAEPRPIRLVVSAKSAAKDLARVPELLEQEGAAIQSATISTDHGRHVQRFTVKVDSGGQVQRILQRLNAMDGIRAVRELESA
jgi:GTP pyrophosphokinase